MRLFSLQLMEAVLYNREPQPWQRNSTRRDELNAAGFVLDGILSKVKTVETEAVSYTHLTLPTTPYV